MPTAAFNVFRPYIDRTNPKYNSWHVSAPDKGEADLHADVETERFDGLMISRFSNGVILDLLIEFAAQADAVILPPGCPAMLTAENQREHLPDELQADTVVVSRGADIKRTLDCC
jgi:hypothetical protein